MKIYGTVALLAAALAMSSGCSSMSSLRYGQLTTGGHIALTEAGLGISPADDGFGFKVQLGHLQFGATTIHDPEAKHLALGIHSSTGFDGAEKTAITSATRIGAGPVNLEGDLAVGLGRITLNGLAEINDAIPPGAYFDHWTGMTAKYEPFPDVPATWNGNALDITGEAGFGPVGLNAGLSTHACEHGVFKYEDGHTTAGIGPFTLDLGATCGECTQGIGVNCFIGWVDRPSGE